MWTDGNGYFHIGDRQPGERAATAAEIAARNATQQWDVYQATVQAQLDENDRVALRCWKAGAAYPADWQAYDKALRSIIGQSQPATIPTTLPAQPASYPAGT